MTAKAPNLNWPYIVVVIGLAFAALATITWLVSTRGFSDLSPSTSRLAVILIDALCLFGLVALINKVRCDAKTVVDDAGITRPTLLGSRFIPWTDVRQVRTQAFGIQIYGASTRIVVSPYAYADPQAIIAFVRAKVSHVVDRATP